MFFLILQGKRQTAEMRCPYCLYIACQRSHVTAHISQEHAAVVATVEQKGMNSAVCRVENLSKRGTRIVDEQRAVRHLEEIRPLLRDAKSFKVLKTAVKRILLEACVMYGAEDQVERGHFKALKASYDSVLA